MLFTSKVAIVFRECLYSLWYFSFSYCSLEMELIEKYRNTCSYIVTVFGLWNSVITRCLKTSRKFQF